MPEHMLLRPVFHGGELVAFAATIGHMAEIGAVTVGSFAATATEVYQEGLRLPPVKLVRAGEPVEDVWKIILSNHRTPRSTWGDLHAMIGSLELADRRLQALLDRHGAPLALAVWDELLAHGERLMRRRIEAIPDGEYAFEDADGGRRPHARAGDDARAARRRRRPRDRRLHGLRPAGARAGQRDVRRHRLGDVQRVPAGERHRDPAQRRLLRRLDDDRAAGLGRQRPLPRPVGRRQHRDAAEARRHAARRARRRAARPRDGRRGRDGVQLPLRRRPSATGEPYAHYHFEASGWGGRLDGDGQSAQNHVHGNCRNTPIEVFETRFPFRTLVVRARSRTRAGPAAAAAVSRCGATSRCWRRR